MKIRIASKTSAAEIVPLLLAIAAVLLLLLSQASAASTPFRPVSGNGLQIGVSDSGKIMVSTDGLLWKARSLGETKIRSVAFGNGQFVAVGDSGAILTSSNGKHWAQRRSGTETLLRDVAFGNGMFVAVGPGRALLTSPDGSTWTRHSTDNYLYSVNFDGCNFVAASGSGAVTIELNEAKMFAAK